MKFIIIILIVFLLSGGTKAICDYNYCLNGGICSDWWETEFCDCEEEFNGDVCQYEPCAEGPCLNGGDCHVDHDSSTGSYTCICYGDYYGTKCEYDSLHDATNIAVGVIIAIIIGGIIGVVLLAVCIGCICYHSNHRPTRTTTVVAPAPYALQAQYPPAAAHYGVGYNNFHSYQPCQLPQPAS